MIGYVRRLVETLVLDPQGDEARGELRAYRDPTETPIDVDAQELDTLALRSAPVRGDLTGGVEVRHELDVAIAVAHGDPVEAIRIRDAIALDLVLRYVDADLTAADPDPASGQYVTAATWSIDYRPLAFDDTRETATLTFTIDTQLDR